MGCDISLLKSLLEQEQFSALETHFEQLIEAYRKIPGGDAQQTLAEAFDIFGEATEEALARWRETRPDSPLPWLTQGLRHNASALEARGTCSADQVSGAQWRLVHEHFKEAGEWLQKALESPLPAGVALDALMLHEQISGSRTRAEKLFETLQERDPHWLNGWRRMQTIREPRWGGSWPDMEALLALANRTLSTEAANDLTAQHFRWRGSYAMYFENAPEAALGYLDQALQLAVRPQQRAAIHEYRAYALGTLERGEEETAAWQAALSEEEKAEYHCRLGWALEKAGQLLEAIQAMQKGTQSTSKNDREYAYQSAFWLGNFFHDGAAAQEQQLIDHKQALSWLERAFELGDEARKALVANTQGLIHFESETCGDEGKAEQYFSFATEHGDSFGPYNLARLQEKRSGHGAEALALYQLSATRGHAISSRIVIDRLGEIPAEQAEAWLNETSRRGNPDAMAALATRRFREGRRDEAEVLLWQATADPSNLRGACILGRALLAGSFDETPDIDRVSTLYKAISDGSDAFTADVYTDFFLTYFVAQYARLRQGSWAEFSAARKLFTDMEKRLEELPHFATDTQKEELQEILRQLPGNRFSWRFQKWSGKLPVLRRAAPFSECGT